MEILHFKILWDTDRMLFGCDRSYSSARRVSNLNSNVPQGVSTLI